MASEYNYGPKRQGPKGGDAQLFEKITGGDGVAVRVRLLKGGITLRTKADAEALRALVDTALEAFGDEITPDAPEPEAPAASKPAKPAKPGPAKPVKPAKPELAPVDPTWDLAEGDLDGTGGYAVVVIEGVQYWQALAS
jgi:hypothetical protein